MQVTKTFERIFRKLDRQIKIEVDSAIRKLAINPLIGKPLRGELIGKWSLRVGNYRIIYVINENTRIITLFSVKHRKKMYKMR
ncbi:MAG: type II toxin-antitoxin system RelE family toxin [Candidatus Helarchaeota archaeon]